MSLFKIIRWKSWSDTKLVFLFIALGIVITNKGIYSLIQQLTLFSEFTLLFIFYGSFVSLANDYWDLEIDKEAKKDRLVAQSSKLKIYSMLAFFLSGFFFILIYY